MEKNQKLNKWCVEQASNNYKHYMILYDIRVLIMVLHSKSKSFLMSTICFFRLFGDESEVNFWTVALHYLRSEKAEPMSKVITQVV